MRDLVPVRRALISLSDKAGLDALAEGLKRHGVEVVSTGGAAVSRSSSAVSTPTTQMPCESYCWQVAGSATAAGERTSEAPTHSSAPAKARATRRMTAPAYSVRR